MGVIKFTQKDLDRNRPFDAGWRSVTVTAAIERLSKKKDSMNHVVTFEVDLDDDDKREFEHNFSEKAIGMAEPFISACIGDNVSANTEYRTEMLIGSKLFAEFSKEIFKDPMNPNDRGRPVNKIVGWASKDNPPF